MSFPKNQCNVVVKNQIDLDLDPSSPTYQLWSKSSSLSKCVPSSVKDSTSPHVSHMDEWNCLESGSKSTLNGNNIS